MILVKTTIKGNWSGAEREVTYSLQGGWAQAGMAASEARDIAKQRTQSMNATGATGIYHAESTSWGEDHWKDLSLADLPGIPLSILKHVLEHIPEHAEEAEQ